MPPPRMPTIIGSTTDSVKNAAIAASMALPPAASISAPAAEASGWLVIAIPRLPSAGCFSQVKDMVGIVLSSARSFTPGETGVKGSGPVSG